MEGAARVLSLISNSDCEKRKELIKELEFYSPGKRAWQRDEMNETYWRLTGGRQANGQDKTWMTKRIFVGDLIQRGFDADIALAAFNAFKYPDQSDYISRYDYILIVGSICYYNSDVDFGTALYHIRIKIVFTFYDKGNRGQLSSHDVEHFVKDMCCSTNHMEKITREMMQTKSSITISDFFDIYLQRKLLDKYLLFMRDIFNNHRLSSAAVGGKRGNCGVSGGGGGPVTKQVLIDPRINLFSAADMIPKAGGLQQQQQQRQPQIDSAPMPSAAIHDDKIVPIIDGVFATVDLRGSAVIRDTEVFDLANLIIRNANKLCFDTLQEQDISDQKWPTTAPFSLLEQLFGFEIRDQSDIQNYTDKIVMLCVEANRILRDEDMVVKVSVPCKVFGDIHGQFRDLLLLFREFGFPCNTRGGDVEAVSYVFDGDFVDRGKHQVEVVILMAALKIAFPARIFLLRGNHEFRHQNKHMGSKGFFQACKIACGDELKGETLFETIHSNVFDYLPMAGLVGEKILVLHGGIGDGEWTIDRINAVPKPLTEKEIADDTTHTLLNILWSDPKDHDENMLRGVHHNDRGEHIVKFGSDVTESFCRKNNLTHIIRGHQLIPEGYRIMHGGHLINLFSARNYCEHDKNDSAVVLIVYDEDNNLRIKPKALQRRL